MSVMHIDETSSEIFAEITADIKLRIPAWYGNDAVLDDSSIELRKYQNSFIARYVIHENGSSSTLLVKIPSKPYVQSLSEALSRKDTRPRAREQYAAALAVWRAIEAEKDEKCMAVKPLEYLYDWNAIAMTEVKGNMLKTFLLRPTMVFRLSNDWRELEEYLYHSVHWLKIVHQKVGKPKNSLLPVDDIKKQVEEDLAALEANSKGQVNINPLRELFFKVLERIFNSTVPTVLLHDDFQYSNILISSTGSACALDSAFSRRGPVYSDLATLLIDPETRLAQVLTFGLFFSKRKLAQLQAMVIESYFQDSPLNLISLKLYCALAILHKWAVDEKLFSSGGIKQTFSTVFIPILRYNFRRILNSYLTLHRERN